MLYGCVFNTSYGPFDNFDINKTKVVGSFIKKFVDARKNNESEVKCWRNWSKQKRINLL